LNAKSYEALTAAVGHEEHPSVLNEASADRLARLAVQHCGSAAVVVQNRRKGAGAWWFVEFAAQRLCPVGEANKFVIERDTLYWAGASGADCQGQDAKNANEVHGVPWG